MKDYNFKIGDAVVFRAFNGDSVSATIVGASAEAVRVAYCSGSRILNGRMVPKMERVLVTRADFGRITPFGGAQFMTLETL